MQDETVESEAVDFLRTMIRNRPNGENRLQQEHAVIAVEKHLKNKEHLLVQAGTGTGKSFAMLVPALLANERTVYSTATKQLSEQLIDQDIPVLMAEMRRQGVKPASAVLLKGRENYLCQKKLSELTGDVEKAEKKDKEGLFSMSEIVEPENIVIAKPKKNRGKVTSDQLKDEYAGMFEWARRTKSGDRSEAPPMSDETWKGVSATNNDCVGKAACPFGDTCYSEAARAAAKKATVVITNHAVTARDLEMDEDATMMGPRKTFIFDEIHELDNFLSSAWGTTITEKILSDTIQAFKKFKAPPSIQDSWEKKLEAVSSNISEFGNAVLNVEHGLIWPNDVDSRIKNVLTNLRNDFTGLAMTIEDHSADEGFKAQTMKVFSTVFDSLDIFLQDDVENVRWSVNELTKEEDAFTKNLRKKRASGKNFKKEKEEPTPPSLHCAPLRIGPRLMNALDAKNATMIGTSATITVGGKFDSPIHDLALNQPLSNNKPHRPFDALDVGTPFDYTTQMMYYLPDSNTFPSADYTNREEHSEAVKNTVVDFAEASGGRGLVLVTTTRAISEVGNHLEEKLAEAGLDIQVLQQGDMPAPQLIEEFVKDETSILVATMGMWHGLNAEGPTCTFVIMDKIPFATMGDPLTMARQKYADDNGGNGFMQVSVALANVKLAQGAGRLIRTKRDKGVVAILDTRLTTKRYGSSMLRSMPSGARTFKDIEIVKGALNRLRIAREEEIKGEK